ncbi:MAG: hypothetical protein K2O14_13855 [Oscillospiraceae bacterium]|nr:hypothetical protein [Oscillospiraceae bacterium]
MNKKRILYLSAAFFLLALAAGCGNTETRSAADLQSGMTYDTDAHTEEVDLPPKDTDCLAVANEITIAFQSLYRNYLQNEPGELAFTISRDSSLMLQDNGMGFMPVVDDEIKCRDDLKNVLTEYCTDEFAERLLDEAVYRDFDGKLFKAWETGLSDPGRAQFGCYIEDCVLDENILTVHFISIGAENENFDIDTEVYCRNPINDEPFDIMLVWENGRWFISDINGLTDESCIAFSYREDITKSMHEAKAETSPDPRTEEIDLPPEDTDCLAVADECALAFQSLFLKYLQYEESELSIKFHDDPSSWITDPIFYRPVINDQIKCCDDLKSIMMEYCTDNFAQELLDNAHYRDYDNAFYKGECELAPAAKYQFGCYINDCVLDGNKMTVDLINIGSENKNFDIDLEYYVRMMMYDQPFEMTLIWESGKWLISDISDGYEDKIGYSYRPEITKSMHEADSAVQAEEIDLPPEDTDCLAVANEITLTFQTLYQNYLQAEESELSFKIDTDRSLWVFPNGGHGLAYVPVINDEIRCCNDLKRILTEYCTDEFAEELLEDANYRDIDGKLYSQF